MSIEVGSKVTGKVTGITNFGAFVELPGGLTGLVHISEVADSYVKDVNDHLKIGDQIEVKVISEKDGKTALSIKKQLIDLKDKLLLIPNVQHVREDLETVVLKMYAQKVSSNQKRTLKIKWFAS